MTEDEFVQQEELLKRRSAWREKVLAAKKLRDEARDSAFAANRRLDRAQADLDEILYREPKDEVAHD